MKKLFAIGKVTKVSGLNGDVRCKPLSRYFDVYINQKPLCLGFSESINSDITLEKVVMSGKHCRYRFSGVDSKKTAESLIGQFVFARVTENDEINWISKDIIGFTIITNDGEIIGSLKEILWLPSNDVYVIQNNKKEYLIPVIPEVVKEIDQENGILIISPMEGLIN